MEIGNEQNIIKDEGVCKVFWSKILQFLRVIEKSWKEKELTNCTSLDEITKFTRGKKTVRNRKIYEPLKGETSRVHGLTSTLAKTVSVTHREKEVQI